MNTNMLRRFTFLTAAIATGGVLAAVPAAAQNEGINSGLYSNEAYIRACRETNTTVQVYDNSDLAPVTNRIGTLPANTQVTLTGVLATGTAQVYIQGGGLSDVQPVGWIDAAALGPCEDESVVGTPAESQVCFAADVNLNVRSQPATNSAVLGSYRAGNVIYTTAEPPIERIAPVGRVWMEVDYQGEDGWVAQTGRFGNNSNVTPIVCP